ncbi:VOC family protein [Myxococcota bacterium]|nr:VOC family protein [Myxococcota bacterium]
MGQIRRLMHFGISVSDLRRSVRFYRDALGFTPVSKLRVEGFPTTIMFEVEEMELECVFLERDGFRIELMSFPKPGSVGDGEVTPWRQRGLAHFACSVEDLEATRKAIVEYGGTILEHTYVENDDPQFESKVLCAACPDGVRIELVESRLLDPADPLGEPVELGEF